MQTTALEIQNDIIRTLDTFDNLLYGFAYIGDIASCKFKNTPYAITIGLPLSPTIVDDIISGPNQVYYDEYLSVNDT